MEVFKIIISILFLLLAVYYVNRQIGNILDEKMIYIRVGVIFASTLICLYCIDLIVYPNQKLMIDENRKRIFDMVSASFVAIIAMIIYKNNRNQ